MTASTTAGGGHRSAVSVLVTSAGTASAVSVIKALRQQAEYEVRLFAIDSDPTAPGLYLADGHRLVPPASDPAYIRRLLEICSDFHVEALVPIHSREIDLIAAHSGDFAAAGVRLLLGSVESIRRCNDKRAMYEVVSRLGIAVPRPWSHETPVGFPLFAKPNGASGSTGSAVIEDEEELRLLLRKHPDHLVQELVAGPEFTVDALCDRDSRLVVASPRRRLSVKAGQMVKGTTVESPAMVDACARICAEVGVVGACNLQFIERDGEPVFIEVNPRFAAGGLMLTVAAGANLPLLALKLMLGEDFRAPSVRAGLTMLRYWDELFITDQDVQR